MTSTASASSSAANTRCSRSLRSRIRQNAGYTIIEVQVAVILMLIALWGMGSHSRIYNELISGIEDDNAVQGVVNPGVGRATVSVSSTGSDAGPPPCEIRLLSLNTGGTYPVAQVQVRQRGL